MSQLSDTALIVILAVTVGVVGLWAVVRTIGARRRRQDRLERGFERAGRNHHRRTR